MPLQSNVQLLKLHYREFLRKTAAYHRGEGGDASAYNYYVERARVEATFDTSLQKLAATVTSINISELRASYRARKERAKERLRRAFDDRVSQINSYLSNSGNECTTSKLQSKVATVHDSSQTAEALPTNRPTTASAVADNPDPQQLFGTDGFLRRTLLYLLGHAARAYMTGLNTTRVEGMAHMSAALQRPAGQALITVSNHVAALDDPLVVSVLLPEAALERPESLRWTLCATDRCFRYASLVPLFRAVKVLPVVRGGGLSQTGMAAAESRLAAGDWVHIFPEGTRSRDGVTLGAVRKGVGRLVASVPEGAPPPLVVPFVHGGMEGVMPRGAVLPAVGQQIDVLVGEPIPMADLLSAARSERWPADRLHTAVAARVAHGLKDLRRRLDAVRAGQPDPGPAGATERPASSGGGGGGGGVSSLDQFDPADLALAAELRAARRRREGGAQLSEAWERFKSRMVLQHRSWATQGHAGTVAAAVAAAGKLVGPQAGGAVAAGREMAVGMWSGGAVGQEQGRGSGAAGGSSLALLGEGSPYARELLAMARRGPWGREGAGGA